MSIAVDRNKIEGLVLKNRTLHTTTTRINANPQQNYFHALVTSALIELIDTQRERVPQPEEAWLGRPPHGFPWTPLVKDRRIHFSNSATKCLSKLFRKPLPFFSNGCSRKGDGM